METMEEKLAYVLGEQAEETPSEETPKETEQPEAPSQEEKKETPTEEPKEQEAEPQPEPEENREEESESEEHMTRSQKRKLYVQRLEEENRRYKERVEKHLPWNQDEPVELTREQLDEIIDRRVIEREHRSTLEAQHRAWVDDYKSSISKYPELDPKSKAYNKELDTLLTDLLTDSDGNPKLNLKVSEAYERMKKSLDHAKTTGAENASLKLAEQKAKEAIAPSATGKESDKFTWEDMAKLQESDPEAYYERIRKGQIPN